MWIADFYLRQNTLDIFLIVTYNDLKRNNKE